MKSTERPSKSQPATQQPAHSGKKVIAAAAGAKQSDLPPTQKQQGQPRVICQSIGLFSGRLESFEGKLHLLCPDGTRLPVSGIDSSLAVWLFNHLATVSIDQHWVCYPRSVDNNLQLFLKGVNPKRFDLEPDHCRVVGKVFGIREDSLLIGIQRNIDRKSFKKLQRNGIVKTTPQLQSFVTVCKGQVPGVEIGQNWKFLCERHGNQLVISSSEKV